MSRIAEDVELTKGVHSILKAATMKGPFNTNTFHLI
jgi:hypothetical protein